MTSGEAQSSDIEKYRRALAQARETISQLLSENQKLSGSTPIAISGMSCRFPGGANSPSAYWHLLRSGQDGISNLGDRRWPKSKYFDDNPDTPGKMYTDRAGLISQSVDLFDAAFFGISPGEATALDPQQRLLMETSWEALEDAGIIPATLNHSKTGFFIGMSGDDYARFHRHSGDPKLINAYSLTGSTMSTAAGRLSYFYGSNGPSLTLDTACSSSLVALHLAVQSLQSGESDLALVGASNLILLPEVHVAFCRLGALSPDGACKTFSADADGYVRSEGTGFVVLERLEDCEHRKSKIYGVVNGSAINQDGRTAGLSAPSARAQQEVILTALDDARLEPSQIDYVETHGTGTNLGDPIEIEALFESIGKRRDRPLLIGSAKSNIGHMEPTAGLGGLIKILLSLQHQQLPGNLHFERPNPLIQWSSIPFQVVSKTVPWHAQHNEPRRAGLSAFGFSGTNAHIIISEHTKPEDFPEPPSDPIFTLECSAKSPESLQQQAKNYLDVLQSKKFSTFDLCASAHLHRSRFPFRKWFSGKNDNEIESKIETFLREPVSNSDATPLPNENVKSVWTFTGQGSQYPGMGAELYDQDDLFRSIIDVAAEILSPFREVSITNLITGRDPHDCIHQTEYSQPALFALEYALAQRWVHWGFQPDAVLGHSIGEYVAACISGVMSFEDALKLVECRGRLMGSLPSGGGMAAVQLSEHEVYRCRQEFDLEKEVDFAAVNSVTETVISGSQEAISEFCTRLETSGNSATVLNVSHAFHSYLMDPILDEFRKTCESISLNKPEILMALNLDGSVNQDLPASSDYWCRQIRSAVRFDDCYQTLKNYGHTVFLEMGPQPILTQILKSNQDSSIRALSVLSRGQSSVDKLATAHERLLETGVTPDWEQRYRGYRFVELPLYPFDHQHFWATKGYEMALNDRGSSGNYSELSQSLKWKSLELGPPLKPTNWLIAGNFHTKLLQDIGDAGSRLQFTKVELNSAWEILNAQHPDGIIIQASPDSESVTTLTRHLEQVRFLVRTIASSNLAATVWIIGDPVSQGLSTHACRGLMQTLLLEYPTLCGGLIELHQNQASSLGKVLGATGLRGWFRVESKTVQYPAIAHDIQSKESLGADLDSVIISGGLGGIGLSIAEALCARDIPHICLISRTAPSEATSKIIEKFRHNGSTVEVHTLDVAKDNSKTAIRDLASRFPQSTFFHCAGVMPIDGENDISLAFEGKVQGGLNITNAISDFPDIHLVMMGSISAITGTPGISAYSAANGALTGIVTNRTVSGGRGVCVNWGPWLDGRIIGDAEIDQTQASGFSDLTTNEALDALSLTSSSIDHPCVVNADWQRVSESFSIRKSLTLFEDIAEHSKPLPDRTSSQGLTFFADLPDDDKLGALFNLLQTPLSQILGLTPSKSIDIERGFFDQGMDSIKALEFRESIDDLTGIRLEATDIFDYPTLSRLGQYLLSLVSEHEASHTDQPVSEDRDIDIETLSEEDLSALIDAEYLLTQPQPKQKNR